MPRNKRMSISSSSSDSDDLPSAEERLRSTTPPPAYVTPPVSPGKVNKDGSPRKEYTFRKYAQLDKEGNVIKIWDSAAEAAIRFGLNKHTIRNAANPNQPGKFAAGYRWARYEPDLPGEIWKPHPVYTDIQVSNKGRVCHKHGKKTHGSSNSTGYLYVRLYVPDGQVFRVHRLVMQTFAPYDGDDRLMHVNHKDGNTVNNCLENLEWRTPLGNTEHYVKYLLPKRKKQRLMKEALEGRFTRPEQVVEEKTIHFTDGTYETVKTVRTIHRKIPIEEAVARVQAMDD